MATSTIAAYAGDIIPLGELVGSDETPGIRAEVAEDCSSITIVWVESLQYHMEHWPEHMEHLVAPKSGPDDEDEAVYFTDEARQEFATYMIEFLANEGAEKADILPDDGEEWDDESCVAISCRFDTPNGPNTSIEEAGDKAWPFIASMTNVTDPGTFNCPYVMGDLARRIAAKHEEG